MRNTTNATEIAILIMSLAVTRIKMRSDVSPEAMATALASATNHFTRPLMTLLSLKVLDRSFSTLRRRYEVWVRPQNHEPTLDIRTKGAKRPQLELVIGNYHLAREICQILNPENWQQSTALEIARAELLLAALEQDSRMTSATEFGFSGERGEPPSHTASNFAELCCMVRESPWLFSGKNVSYRRLDWVLSCHSESELCCLLLRWRDCAGSWELASC